MSLWQVQVKDQYLYMGGKKRVILNAHGCNQPFKNRFWCPQRKWFLNEPCPFVNKWECNNYRRICGSL